jgi:hypothetical protein
VLKDICAAIKALWAAWREPPPTRAEQEQYHDAKMQAESGVFAGEKERETQEAPPSVVDSLLTNGHDKESWLQKPGEHTFNDAMGGETRYVELLSKLEQNND